MSEPTRASHPKQRLLSTGVEGFDSLAELALDTRSSWNHATDPVWRPATDHTARVVPHCDGVAIPLEDARILWQR